MNTVKKTIADNIQDKNADNLLGEAFESLGGSSIDYKTYFDFVDTYAKAFLELGVKNGDVVTICTAGTLDTAITFSALNKIGAVAQFVNPIFLKNNPKRFIDGTNSKLLVCLDRFYPAIKDSLASTGVEQVLVSSLSEYSSFLYKLLIRRKKISSTDKIAGVKYIDLPDFIRLGELSSIKTDRITYEKDKPAVITYTSGTTGNPKGVVHTNDSLNNMLTMYDISGGFGIGRGERNLVLIPPMYLTSFMHSIYGPMYMGATNIMQSVYNPKTLGQDLKKYEPKTVVASKAHYINLQDSKLPKNSLSKTKYAYCGGEAISRHTAQKINNILEYYGILPMVLGYGQTELGTMAMFNYKILDRVNESGLLIPGVEAKIIDFVTGEPVTVGKRGELYINSPAVMQGYLDNEEANSKYFVIDDNGKKWAKTGDVAEVVGQFEGEDIYNVSGRSSDSFIDSDNNVVYLFDIETLVEDTGLVREAEVVSTVVDGKRVPIVHIVLDDDKKSQAAEILKKIDSTIRQNLDNPNAIPYAYKIRKEFGTSPLSGKRDYESLPSETTGFVRFEEDGELIPITINSDESKEHSNKVFQKK